MTPFPLPPRILHSITTALYHPTLPENHLTPYPDRDLGLTYT